MTQTFLPQATLLFNTPDNNTRIITPQRLRDVIVSLAPFIEGRDPNVNDDGVDSNSTGAFVGPGSFWLNIAFGTLFICTDNSPNAAVWFPVAGTAPPSVTLTTFTYDVGTNAFLVGGTGITPTHPATGDFRFTFGGSVTPNPAPVVAMGSLTGGVDYMVTGEWFAPDKLDIHCRDVTNNGHDPATLYVFISG